jgi:LysR family hydrogen peroxide-inducible transcriptional activator
MTSPTVVQLRAFAALADTLHFGEAAARLGVSQPSVSAAVSGLESVLGVALVVRSSRKVALTPAGVEAATKARRALAEVDTMAALGGGHGHWADGGPLRLGVIPTVAPYILAPVLRGLARWAPRLRLEVTEGQTARLEQQLGAGALDAVVLALPAGRADVVEAPLYWEDFVLLVPPGHRLADRADLAPEVLRELPLLLLEEGHCLSGQALDLCRQVGAPTDHPARAASLTTIAQLVAAGMGTTLVPATALAVESRKGKVAAARFRAPAPGRLIGLAWRPGGRSGYLELAEQLRASLDRPGFAGRLAPAAPAAGALV